MNYKFDISEEKTSLRVTVTIPKRKTGLDKRVRVGTKTVTKLVEDNFTCPKNFKIGLCLTPGMELDNDFDKCKTVWEFKLINQKPTPKITKKTISKRKPKKSSK